MKTQNTAALTLACLGLAGSFGCQATPRSTALPTASHFRPSAVETSEQSAVARKKKEAAPARSEDPAQIELASAETPAAESKGGASGPTPAVKQAAEGAEVPKEPKGSEPLVEVLSLPDLERFALEHNPAIRQAAAAVSKAVGFREQVGRYPNPMGGYNGTQLADQGTDQHVGFIEQEIVLGGKLKRNRLVLEQEVQAQLWQVEMTRLRVLTDIRVRFYETLAAQQRLNLAVDFEGVTRKGVDAAQKRLDALEGSRPELLQAKIQQSEVELVRQKAEIAFRAAWNSLFATVGMPCLNDGALAGSLEMPTEPRDWEELYSQLIEVSPEVRMACSRVARAQANLDRQQVQPIPNLSVMVAGGYDNGTGSNMVNTQVGLPIPIFNRNDGNTSAAWAEYCRATQEMQRIKLDLRTRLLQAGREYDSAAVQVNRYQSEIVPNAREALDLSEQAYRAGEFEFLQVLIVRRTYFDSSILLIDARTGFAQANALVDGLLLSDGLSQSTDTDVDDGLRGQTLSGQ